MSENYFYSEKYFDTEYEYRHVHVPKEVSRKVQKLLSEKEWRNLGVQQSQGWEHYMLHKPEPNVLLFRRRLTIK